MGEFVVNFRVLSAGKLFRFLCVMLAMVMATGPSASVIAQTNAAQQAVRQRVQGISRGSEAPQSRPQQPTRTGGDQTLVAEPSAGMIDTTYVSPAAAALIALRPAQIMTSPMAEMLPTEVASAAGMTYLGFDPADVDEVIAFMDQITPMGPPEWAVVIKFNKPFRGSSINPQIRAHTQLGELAGRKYLQSTQPAPMFSFYGPDSQTLIVAPDVTLRRLVESAGQQSSGPVVDRIRSVPGGNDLYAVVDIESLRPILQLVLAQAQANVPPDYQQFLQAPNLMKAYELTFNLSGHPIAMVLHANDEAAAQQLETLVAESNRKSQEQLKAVFAAQATSEDPVQRALAQYVERLSNSWMEGFAPQREGASLVYFKSGGENSAEQKQLLNVAFMGVLVALLLPAIQAARQAAQRNQSEGMPADYNSETTVDSTPESSEE